MEEQTKRDKIIDTIGSACIKICVLMMMFSWVVAYYPYYEKLWYEKTQPVTWERYEAEAKAQAAEGRELLAIEFTGYPTEGMTTDLKSYEQFLEAKDEPICLEVDAAKLKPTGVYEKVYDFSRGGSTNSYSKYNRVRGGTVITPSSAAPQRTTELGAFFYRYKAIYAQYYVLSFEERGRILILINDTVVDIPKKGKVRLPFATGTWTHLKSDDSEMWDLIIANNLQYDRYHEMMYTLDASTWWFEFGLDKREFEEVRTAIGVILLAGGGIGLVLTFVLMLLLAKRDVVRQEDNSD